MDKPLKVFVSLVGALALMAVGPLSRWPIVASPEAPLAPIGSAAFTYQGQLRKNGAPVNASCNASFRLFDDGFAGAQIGPTVTSSTLQVSNGLFTIALEFGWDAFNTQARWLETEIGCGETPVTLAPRTAMNPAPYALALPGMRTVPGNLDGLSRPTINVIGGKLTNAISPSAFNSYIGGGDGNVIEYNSSTSAIAAGYQNRIESASYSSVISSGNGNDIQGLSLDSVIAGGASNSIGGNSVASFIGAGASNIITNSAYEATIPGGYRNRAEGQYSFAAGALASALHNGAFVWSDSSSYTDPISSTAPKQFVLRATGGIRLAGTGLNSTTSPAFIHQAAPCGSGTFDGARTAINHPLANGDPNAVLLVTPNYGNVSGNGPVPRDPVAVYYEDSGGGGCPTGHWVIYPVSATPLPFTSTMRFNVMIIKP